MTHGRILIELFLSSVTLGGNYFILGWLRKWSLKQMRSSIHQVLASNGLGQGGH